MKKSPYSHPKSLDEKLWKKVAKGSCWIFNGCLNRDGYGLVRHAGKYRLTHRLVWEIFFGPPGKKYVLHHCDTPACVRPQHLFLGDAMDNIHDAMAKGRKNDKGEANGNSKLTASKVLEIRTLRAAGTKASMIAIKYGVTREQVWNITSRRHWAHI